LAKAKAKDNVLTDLDYKIIRSIQTGMQREHVLKKYKITGAKYDSLNSLDKVEDLKVDDAITRLTTNDALLKAASVSGIPWVEEIHGLKRLDQNMQQLGNNIVLRLSDMLEGTTSAAEMLLIVQCFTMLRKSMFNSDITINNTQNNFTSLPAISNTKV
jgi:hypothetical protein